MKKYTWIVALLLALSLALVGCPGESGGGDDDKKDDDKKDGGGGGIVKTIKLEQNTYSDGYQYKEDGLDEIKKGDVFILKMTFTVDRDVVVDADLGGEGKIGIGLVDTTQHANDIDPDWDESEYWHPISWGNSEVEKMFYTAVLEKGKEYTVDTELKALKDSGGADKAKNVLIFQTEKEFEKVSNGGVLQENDVPGDITISCTEYEFKKKAE